MIGTPGSILTLGLGGSPSLMVTLGYGIGAYVPPVDVPVVQKRGFAGFPRSHLWIAHINGKRYVGTYDELEQALGEVVEKTARKPRVVIKPGTPISREGAVSVMPQRATIAEAKAVQQQLTVDIAPLLARVIRQRQDEEDEDLILLL